MGESWHNNHHAFPGYAFHGLKWWQVDLSGYVIRGLRITGLAWNLKGPHQRLTDQPAAAGQNRTGGTT
jgi:stearoyl-CoA desaturase (delta-9 desaturase)